MKDAFLLDYFRAIDLFFDREIKTVVFVLYTADRMSVGSSLLDSLKINSLDLNSAPGGSKTRVRLRNRNAVNYTTVQIHRIGMTETSRRRYSLRTHTHEHTHVGPDCNGTGIR